MKVIYNKDISSKIEHLIKLTGRDNFLVIINNIDGFFHGSNWAKSDIMLVERGERPTYLYKIDYNTRLVFTRIKVGNEDKILLVDVLTR